MSGFTATTSPAIAKKCQVAVRHGCGRSWMNQRTEFLPETLGAEMVESMVGNVAGCHSQKQ